MRISDGAKAMNVVILNPPGSAYEVKDVWTTVLGKWYASNDPYSVPKWAIDEYAIAGELGGGEHLYVRVLDEFGNVDLKHVVVFKNTTVMETKSPKPQDGFANMPVWNVFFPDKGENGNWETGIVTDDKFLVQGGGLPYGLHVSLFVVYQKKSSGNGNGNGEHHMQVSIDANNTTVHVHTNGHEFNMEITK